MTDVLITAGELAEFLTKEPCVVIDTRNPEAYGAGHLAGAAMDVTEIEPLPMESRLWDQPNVLITPHVAGQSARRIDDMTNFFCENLRRHVAGQPLKNLLVDKSLGFPPPDQGE